LIPSAKGVAPRGAERPRLIFVTSGGAKGI
jgi:hypothetical protein